MYIKIQLQETSEELVVKTLRDLIQYKDKPIIIKEIGKRNISIEEDNLIKSELVENLPSYCPQCGFDLEMSIRAYDATKQKEVLLYGTIKNRL